MAAYDTNAPGGMWAEHADSAEGTGYGFEDEARRQMGHNQWQFGGTPTSQGEYENYLAQQQHDASGRNGVQLAGREFYDNRAQELGARNAQQDAANYWAQAAAGNGPSVAQSAYQLQANGAMQGQAAQLAAGRGGLSSAMATRAAMNGGGQMDQLAAGGANMRQNELAQAMGQYSGAAQQMRGGDLSRADQSAQWSGRQAQLDMAQRARNDAMEQFYAQQRMQQGMWGSDRGRDLYNQEQDRQRNWGVARRNYQQQQDDRNSAVTGAILGGTGAVVGGLAGGPAGAAAGGSLGSAAGKDL